jgi:mannitol/fructose-specific phosphotransferase system IIA component (Ntr-type)
MILHPSARIVPGHGNVESGRIRMEIKEFLLPTDTLIKAHGADKTRLLQELAARAAAALNLDANLISIALLKREDLGSTGTGGDPACSDTGSEEAIRHVGSSQARHRL